MLAAIVKHRHRPVRRSAPGSPPGTISPPDEAALPTRLHVVAYGHEGMIEEDDVSVARVADLRDAWPVVWVDVVGLATTERLREIQASFAIHPLVIEDVVNVGQRPKVEEYEDYDFIVLRLVGNDLPGLTDQIGILLKGNCVLTFMERPGPHLNPVRERIRRSMGRMRQAGADYLTYSVIDTIIDLYIPVLDHYSERIDALEQEIIDRPNPDMVGRIHELRHEILLLRRAVRPMLDVVGRLHNEEVPLFSREVKPYLRDCLDHAVRLVDAVDSNKDAVNSLMELHMSSLSQRMNEVMKVLTMIATIFIPLSFIAGLYGMNFDPRSSPWNMPELQWRYGYPYALGLMFLLVAGMLFYFRHKGWLGGSRK